MRKFTKRSAAVVVPVAVLSVAGVAYAANLGVVSDLLGGGQSSVDNTCNIAASYQVAGGSPADVQFIAVGGITPAKDATATAPAVAAVPAVAGYYLTHVTVTPRGSSCANSIFRLSVLDNSGAQISEYSGAINSTGAVQDVLLDRPVLAQSVTGLAAVVTKPASAS